MLQPGTTVLLSRAGLPLVLEDVLGGGGQGTVYRARLPDGTALALKWYAPIAATAGQRKALDWLVSRGSPQPRFIWPLDVASALGEPEFGYAMPLIPKGFVESSHLITGQAPASLRTIARVGAQAADAFLCVHGEGLCYKDINFGNVAADPTTGDIVICDNDNVTVDGDPEARVKGVVLFMAPEVLLDQARPSKATDLHSLAVWLFYLLMRAHPLEGRRAIYDVPAWDDFAAKRLLLGEEPRFIFDPADDSNAPDPDPENGQTVPLFWWPLYPGFVQRLFVQAFTAGVRNGHDRVREAMWRAALEQLQDVVYHCPSCGQENFHDEERTEPRTCWSCALPLARPSRLLTRSTAVVLAAGTQLTRHHLTGSRDFTVVGTVEPHPNDPKRLGLRNTGDSEWTVYAEDGSGMPLLPGRAVGLCPMQVAFAGGLQGRVLMS